MIALTIEGKPPRKNDKHSIRVLKKGKRLVPIKHLTHKYRDWLLRVKKAWALSSEPPADAGEWHCKIDAYWPRKRKLYDRIVPFGDVDAVAEPVLDGLETAGVIDDDIRIVSLEIRKFHDAEQPRVIVELIREG